MKPATASVAALLGITLLSAPVSTAHAGSRGEWTVTPSPFAGMFVSHGRTVTGEAGGTTAGPGGRLSYQAEGSYHRLTDLTGERAVPGGMAYSVATDEPGRAATVTARGAFAVQVSS